MHCLHVLTLSVASHSATNRPYLCSIPLLCFGAKPLYVCTSKLLSPIWRGFLLAIRLRKPTSRGTPGLLNRSSMHCLPEPISSSLPLPSQLAPMIATPTIHTLITAPWVSTSITTRITTVQDLLWRAMEAQRTIRCGRWMRRLGR